MTDSTYPTPYSENVVQEAASYGSDEIAAPQPSQGQGVDDPKQTMEQLLDEHYPKKPLRRGDILDGKVIAKAPDEILVDIGYKSEGVVLAREMRTLEGETYEALSSGDNVVVYVVVTEDSKGRIILSIDKARGEQGWRILEKAMDNGDTVTGKIINSNRGGAVVDAEGVHGFIPVSQLVGTTRELYVPDGEPPKEGFIGMEVQFKILELNRRRNRAIFSERQAQQAWKQIQKLRILQELEEGDKVKGKVVGISHFGAFVDLGGADGLIHISELSWDQVKHPRDVVSLGQELEVYVLRIDREGLKIALSLRRLQPEPWDKVEKEFHTGDIVPCTITKVAPFGAFARIAQGIEGLIHISEISAANVKSVEDVLKVGQELNLKIIRIEPDRRRIALSLKQLEEDSIREELAKVNAANQAPTESEQQPESPVDTNAEIDSHNQISESPEQKAEVTMSSDDKAVLGEEIVHSPSDSSESDSTSEEINATKADTTSKNLVNLDTQKD